MNNFKMSTLFCCFKGINSNNRPLTLNMMQIIINIDDIMNHAINRQTGGGFDAELLNDIFYGESPPCAR